MSDHNEYAVTAHNYGAVDSVQNGVVTGWARSKNEESGFSTVDIFVDGVIALSVVADQYRSDLDKAGIASGYAAFRFSLPASSFDGSEHAISVREHMSQNPLSDGDFKFQQRAANTPAALDRLRWIKDKVLLRKTPDQEGLRRAINDKGCVAVISTFHMLPCFLSYHRSLISHLNEAGFVCIVIHASDSARASLASIEDLGCFLYVKQNVGYDFGSWATGLSLIDEISSDVDELLLINDSNVGLPSLSRILKMVRTMDFDAVGLTDSYERGYHIQSYCMWFGQKICKSSFLRNFMLNYSFSSDKDVVIAEGELGLTPSLIQSNFRVGCLFPYEHVARLWLSTSTALANSILALPPFEKVNRNSGRLDYREELLARLNHIIENVILGVPMNPTHFFWDTLIRELDFPFLKRELFTANPCRVPSYHNISEVAEFAGPDFREQMLEISQKYGCKISPPIRLSSRTSFPTGDVS